MADERVAAQVAAAVRRREERATARAAFKVRRARGLVARHRGKARRTVG